jgi:hypothetical protein
MHVQRTINDQEKPTFDIISQTSTSYQRLVTTIKALPIRTEISQVKGHQDRHKPWDELDIRAKINVLADTCL